MTLIIFTFMMLYFFPQNTFAAALGNIKNQIINEGRTSTPSDPGFSPGIFEKSKPPSLIPEPKFDLKLPEGGQAFGEELKSIKLIVQGIQIKGATQYSEDTLKEFYIDLIGKEVTLADVYQIENKITHKYRQDGFILSRALIPEQRIQGGVVVIQVIEGYISEIVVEGGGNVEKRIRQYLHKILEKNPVNIKELEKYLLLVNDLPGISIESILQPSDEDPGASNLVAIVSKDLIDGSARYDNYGSHYVGPTRGSFDINLNSFLGLGEKLSLNFLLASPASELKYSQVAISVPVGHDGFSIDFKASQGPSEPDDDLAVLETETDSTSQTVLGYLPVIRSRNFNLTFDAGYTRTRTDVSVLKVDFIIDRVKAFHLKGTVDFLDDFGGSNKISLQAKRGYDFAQTTDEGSLLSSRPEAHPSFITYKGEIERNQNLQNYLEGLNLAFLCLWQYSDEPLLSSEEFGVGGRTIGRGFDAGEILGDKGYAVSAELQYSIPNLWGLSSHMYAFYHMGKVWNRDEVDQKTDNEKPRLESHGVGARFFWEETMSFNIEISKPLTRVPADHSKKQPRYQFGMTYNF